MQSPDPQPRPSRPACFVRRALRIRRDESGAAAVEFALVAIPFFMLLFAIIEIALVFWATQVLETAVADASRQLYTGQFNTTFTSAQTAAASSGGEPPTQANIFKDLICAKVKALIPCSSIRVDVQAYSTDSFPAGVQGPTKMTAGNRVYDDDFGKSFAALAPSQIMLVRTSAELPIFTSFIDASIVNRPNADNTKMEKMRLIFATAAFKTEPFQP